MGGSQNIGEESDNPVAINVTAMVDVIFCLCLFFMCSLHFKQLEGKIESWLPKDKGVHGDPVKNVVLEEIRVILRWDANSRATEMKLGARAVANDSELGELLAASHADFVNLGKAEVPVIIDAEPHVPWKDVINVLNICKSHDLQKIEFAAPMPGKS